MASNLSKQCTGVYCAVPQELHRYLGQSSLASTGPITCMSSKVDRGHEYRIVILYRGKYDVKIANRSIQRVRAKTKGIS